MIRARVVGYAMPAETPPTIRADDEDLDRSARTPPARQAGIDSPMPSSSIILRPYRSPSAPSHRTDAARPSEYPTATRSSCRLRRVEREADRRQGDVRDRQVEVRDRRDDDQRRRGSAGRCRVPRRSAPTSPAPWSRQPFTPSPTSRPRASPGPGTGRRATGSREDGRPGIPSVDTRSVAQRVPWLLARHRDA